MLHEVLLALLGHTGSIIQEEPAIARSAGHEGAGEGDGGVSSSSSCSSFRVPETITFLTPTERAAINRVVGVGKIYRDLRHFSTRKVPTWVDGRNSAFGDRVGAVARIEEEGLYMRALKLGVEELLDEYANRVAEVEKEVMTDPTQTVARVHAGVREYQSVLAAVAEVCATVTAERERGKSRGPQVLELLHAKSSFGQPDVRRRLRRLVWCCSEVLFNQCFAWMLHGQLLDPYEEFFICKNVDRNLDHVASKRGVAAIISVGLDGVGLNDIEHERSEGLTSIEDGLDGSRGGAGDWRAEEEWNSTYTLRLPLIPTSFVPQPLAQKMLFVGKVVRVLRQGDGASNDGGVRETEVLELSQRWADLRERDAFNLLALERAVKQAHSLVGRRLYRLLVDVSGFEGHLSSLKGLFLMGRGALFHSFFDKAREAMRSPAGDRAVVELNTWLASAGEDGEDEGCNGKTDTSGVCLDRVRLDLDPLGFECGAFHDLSRQGFRLTGKAAHTTRKTSVCLCPGKSHPLSPIRGPPPINNTARAPLDGGMGRGSLWYTSRREMARGFNSLVGFRCDRPKSKPSSGLSRARSTTKGGREVEVGTVSLVLHNHPDALGDQEAGTGATRDGAAELPNSLSIRLEIEQPSPDGGRGGQVSIRSSPHRRLSLQPRPPQSEIHPATTITIAEAALDNSYGIDPGKVNYLAVDYTPGELQPKAPPFGGAEEGGLRSRSRSRLRVFVNDPGRLESPALSVDLDLWAHIEMGGVDWPLHLILTREAMQTYNRLFRLLSLVKRTSFELDRIWPILMQTRGLSNARKSWGGLGPLWMLRTRMAFFVSNLAFHLQVDVVEAAYASLQRDLAAVQDFENLQRVHEEFLSKLRSNFYIDNLNISQGLGRALRHVLRFCCLFIIYGDARDILPVEVNSLQQAFQDEMEDLVPVLERLATELAMRLDFNGHFSTPIV